MSFTFRQIEIFVEAAADGNFRKTADRLGISQPAVSKQIRALEKSVGKALFRRQRGSAAALSSDGEAMLLTARDMLRRQRAWGAEAVSAEPLALRVLTGDYLLDSVIKPALPELVRRFPEVSLEFHALNDREHLFDQLRNGKADLAIYTGDPPPPDMEKASRILSVIPCGLFATPDIARQVGADIDAIQSAPFILPTVARTSSWVLRALERAHIRPTRVAARVQFGDVLAEMVLAGSGIGLLFDDHAKRRYGDLIQKLPVTVEPAYRVITFGERGTGAVAQSCVRYLCELCITPES